MGIEPFRLKKDLVAVLAGEAVNFVLDRGTVARTDALDHAGVHRRTVETGANYLVTAGIGMSDPAWHLAGVLLRPAEKGKHRHRIVAGLDLQPRIIDAAAIETWGGAGLKTTDRKCKFPQSLRQRDRRWIAGTACWIIRQSDVDQAAEKSASSQNHRPRVEADAELRDDAGNAIATNEKIIDRLLEQGQVGLVLQAPPDRRLVENAVGLSPGRPYRRPLARIQDTELDAGFVGSRGHGAAERVHFSDQVTFADASYGGIAGHLAQGFDVVRQEQSSRAGPGASERRLRAGMAATNDYYVEMRGKKHRGGDHKGGAMIRLPFRYLQRGVSRETARNQVSRGT